MSLSEERKEQDRIHSPTAFPYTADASGQHPKIREHTVLSGRKNTSSGIFKTPEGNYQLMKLQFDNPS